MKIKIFIIPILLFLCSSNTFAATFKGKVIDADTKDPIEGAAVVAVWHEETATVAGPSSRFKDVKETLTDKDGNWVIKGPKGRDGGNITAIFTFLTGSYYTEPPEFIVFKPGYCPYPTEFMIPICKEKTKTYNFGKSNNIGEIVELPKLIKKEDRKKAQGIWPSLTGGDLATAKKLENFVRLLDEERRYLGLGGRGWISELDAKVSDYLVLNNIGPYKLSSRSEFMGIGFNNKDKNLKETNITTERHSDELGSPYRSYKEYNARYIGEGAGLSSPTVEIQIYYSGHELLHDVEAKYRSNEWKNLGLIIQGTDLIVINENKIIFFKEDHYRWLSKNVVIEISCANLTDNICKPIEVIQAYLQKFPSTIPKALTFNQAHDFEWIKNEMNRRLSISYNWLHLLRTGSITEKKALKGATDSMNLFLDYRYKYYNVQSKDEKELLQEHLNSSHRKWIENKLSEYQKWLRENKEQPKL